MTSTVSPKSSNDSGSARKWSNPFEEIPWKNRFTPTLPRTASTPRIGADGRPPVHVRVQTFEYRVQVTASKALVAPAYTSTSSRDIAYSPSPAASRASLGDSYPTMLATRPSRRVHTVP